MTTEKTEYTPVVVGASQPPLPGQPAFPVAFGTNVPGPSTLEGHVPGAGVHPFPPPTAFAPGVPGDFGMAVNPNQGQSGFANPSYPAYPPPAYGFNENIAGGCLKHCHFFFSFNFVLSLSLPLQEKFSIMRIHQLFMRIKSLILDWITRPYDERLYER